MNTRMQTLPLNYKKTFSEAGKTSFVELGRRPDPVFLQPEIELPQMRFKTGHTITCPAKCFSRDGLGLHPSLRKKIHETVDDNDPT